jgi:hypothetical protein
MVEGPGVHRVATRHKQILLNRTFLATSPNGRFTDGAKSISGKKKERKKNHAFLAIDFNFTITGTAAGKHCTRILARVQGGRGAAP